MLIVSGPTLLYTVEIDCSGKGQNSISTQKKLEPFLCLELTK